MSRASAVRRVLVTGSEGLIGGTVRDALRGAGFEVVGLGRAAAGHERGDTRDRAAVLRAIAGCSGVIHLAAVSRVLEAEQDPRACWSINVEALAQLLELAREAPLRPWVVFGSSREVYGDARGAVVQEDAPLNAVNTYAASKIAGEELVAAARAAGARATTVRFSNVYGRATDHADRVIPAFVRAALTGAPLIVRGADHAFDFTHVEDVSGALTALAHLLDAAPELPPTLHLVTGRSTSLGALAHLVRTRACSTSPIVDAPVSALHVRGFHGSPARASRVLGFRARVPLEVGIATLVADMRRALSLPRSSAQRHDALVS